MGAEEKPTIAAQISAIVIVIAVFALIAAWAFLDVGASYWLPIVKEHFAAVVGLPMAAAGAFVVVVLLKQGTKEPIEFEGLGFKFRGPSGLVVLWLMCFLGIALGIKLLW